MARGHARYLERALKEYMETENNAERTRELCQELLDRMDECLPRS